MHVTMLLQATNVIYAKRVVLYCWTVAFDTLFESLDQIQDVQSANQTSVSVIHKTDRRVLLWQYGIG
ncbi:hypothetical protein Tco_1495003 [Tanacetum coccineum]